MTWVGTDAHRLRDSAMLEKVCTSCELAAGVECFSIIVKPRTTILGLIGNTPPDGYIVNLSTREPYKIRSDRARRITSFWTGTPLVPEITILVRRSNYFPTHCVSWGQPDNWMKLYNLRSMLESWYLSQGSIPFLYWGRSRAIEMVPQKCEKDLKSK